MENQPMHTETRYDDLAGTISINFRDGESFEHFAARVAGVDTTVYQPVAMRAYVDREVILTIYATQRAHAPIPGEYTGKLPVKKYKVGTSLEELLNSLRQFDFTLMAPGYAVDELEVTE